MDQFNNTEVTFWKRERGRERRIKIKVKQGDKNCWFLSKFEKIPKKKKEEAQEEERRPRHILNIIK